MGDGGALGDRALPPRGRAVDKAVVTFPVRDGVRELALRRKIAGDVFNVKMWKCGNMQVWKYENGMGAESGNVMPRKRKAALPPNGLLRA